MRGWYSDLAGWWGCTVVKWYGGKGGVVSSDPWANNQTEEANKILYSILEKVTF